MARPAKQTVDYFPHDATASNGKTIFIVEANFGNDGYAFWFKLLELLASTPGHVYDCRNAGTWEFLQAKTRHDADKANKVLDLLSILGAIDLELWRDHRVIWSQNLVDRLADVYKNRRVSAPQKPVISNRNPSAAPISTDDNPPVAVVSTPKSTQSKVKESKVKKEIKQETFEEFLEKQRLAFPTLDVNIEWERCKVWWSEGKKELKRPKTALLNWLTVALKRQKEGIGGKATRDIGKDPFAGWREIAGGPEDSGSISEGKEPGAGAVPVDS